MREVAVARNEVDHVGTVSWSSIEQGMRFDGSLRVGLSVGFELSHNWQDNNDDNNNHNIDDNDDSKEHSGCSENKTRHVDARHLLC